MECIWTFHQQNVGRFVGPQAAQARLGWAMLMRGRSLLGQSSRYLAMMTRLVLSSHQPFKAWSMIIMPIPVHDILISSQSPHSSAPNSHALNYWLAYTMNSTYLLMVLQQWCQSLLSSGEIKKTYPGWSLETFTWILRISLSEINNDVQTWLKNRLTAFRLPVQNRLIKKVNIFCAGNDHLHAFYSTAKNRTNWMKASC